MNESPQHVAVIGCGTVGASWIALLLAHGRDVAAHDPSPDAEERVRTFVERASAQLAELGQRGRGRLAFRPTLAEAVAEADFIQENTPEDDGLKRRVLAEIDRAAPERAIIASSTSALVRSRIVTECATPRRVIVAHPFNPPHLVPLVEIVGEDEAIIDQAVTFYRALGRKPVVLRREMPGHIANRLTAALYREAVHLVEQGVASVADIDAAVRDGPGLRWAIMGPHMTYHLGGGPGGIAHYLAHLGPSQVRRWASLGSPAFGPQVQERIVAGVAEEAAGRPVAELEEERDRLLVRILQIRGEATEREA